MQNAKCKMQNAEYRMQNAKLKKPSQAGGVVDEALLPREFNRKSPLCEKDISVAYELYNTITAVARVKGRLLIHRRGRSPFSHKRRRGEAPSRKEPI